MADQTRPRRSALYMPASNERALEKAKSLDIDAVIVDLEDSVAPEAKSDARAQAVAAVKAGGYGRREVLIRVNAPGTDWGRDDILAAATSGVDAVCVPKVESVDQLTAIRSTLDEGGAPSETTIWAMIETPLAVLNVDQIAKAGPADRFPVSVLLLGTNDLAKETRAAQTPDRLPMLTWLSRCVVATRAYGLDILDGVYNNFRDEEGFRRECQQGRDLGMDGKTLIHPNQIGICNEVFSPSAEDIDWSRKVIAAFDQPENAGKGVITLDGQMVELLHRDIARRTVAIADAIAGDAG
ncbi:MAG: CoA ester lyase [Hyphomicrobiaceae bacterium]|nr:CoA ester lyase [Hyphomicrobiaceae bacterium]